MIGPSNPALPCAPTRAAAVFVRCWHRLEILAPCTLPVAGPAILVCNHTSGLDPAAVQAATTRLIAWMMASEYYDLRAINWFFRFVQAISVDRARTDSTATRAALRALADGRVLGIFPEGRIETSRDLLPFHIGAAMLAIKTKVPVYPVYLDGSQRGKELLASILFPNLVRISFGPAVQFDRSSTSKEALEAATSQIQAAVQALRDRPHPDFL